MYGKLKEFLTNELEGIKAAGLYKNERIITTPQRAVHGEHAVRGDDTVTLGLRLL